MSWSFRELEPNDSDYLFKWRNSFEVYKFLFNPEPVTREKHDQWMKKVIDDESVLLLMAFYNNKEAGTIRFDFNIDRTQAEIGIYLDPSLHGKGLSVEMLREGERLAKLRYGSLRQIIARVVLENKASLAMFERTGYQKKFIQLEKVFENE